MRLISGTVVDCRPARPNKDGSPSKYLDLHLLTGRSVTKFWGFLDSVLESTGGAMPAPGTAVTVHYYTTVKPANEKGPAYESHKVVAVGPQVAFRTFAEAGAAPAAAEAKADKKLAAVGT
jgi:hypothetical protein